MAGLEAVSQMAQQWGNELVNVGAVGSLNPASGFGAGLWRRVSLPNWSIEPLQPLPWYLAR